MVWLEKHFASCIEQTVFVLLNGPGWGGIFVKHHRFAFSKTFLSGVYARFFFVICHILRFFNQNFVSIFQNLCEKGNVTNSYLWGSRCFALATVEIAATCFTLACGYPQKSSYRVNKNNRIFQIQYVVFLIRSAYDGEHPSSSNAHRVSAQRSASQPVKWKGVLPGPGDCVVCARQSVLVSSWCVFFCSELGA